VREHVTVNVTVSQKSCGEGGGVSTVQADKRATHWSTSDISAPSCTSFTMHSGWPYSAALETQRRSRGMRDSGHTPRHASSETRVRAEG
jgi:hypothetical protein